MKRVIKSSLDYSDDAANYAMWECIAEQYCRKIGAELLFVNSDNFGYETKDGQLVHMYADELAEMLKSM